MVGYDVSGVPLLLDKAQPFFDWKERKDIFTDVAATRDHMQGSFDVLIAKTPNGNLQLGLSDATVNFFDVLGVSFPGIQAWKASLGSQASLPVALPYKTGEKKFNHPEIGQTFQTHDGKGIVVNGLLPSNFAPPTGGITENGFVPFEPKPSDTGISRMPNGWNANAYFHVIGRLAPGITPQIAEQAIAQMSGREMRSSTTGGTFPLAVRPVTDIIAKSSKPFVWGAWALGALTLLLCAANLAGLLLTRCVYHLREYAMRSALGATFSNLLRMMLTELFLLSVISALIAAYIARIAMPAIAERLPIKSAAFGQPVFGWEAVVFLIIATLFVAAAGGLLAAVALARNYYKGFSQGIFAVFHSHCIPRIILTASQTAIATVLLCLSWMTVRGYLDIYFRDPGVNTNVRIVEVRTSPSARNTFVDDTLEALSGGDPNARIGALWADVLKNKANSTDGYYPLLNGGFMPPSNFVRITPGLLRTMKVKILAGREFTEQDRNNVIMINETLARQLGWLIREAVGKQVNPYNIMTVIGVVSDFPSNSLDGEISPMLLQPFV